MIVPFILSIAINLPQVYTIFIEDHRHVIDTVVYDGLTAGFRICDDVVAITLFFSHLSVALPGRL